MTEAKHLRQQEAHACAGHLAYAIIQQFGVDIGGAMVRAYARAFLLAVAAVLGWSALDELISEIASCRPPAERAKPHLRVVSQ